MAQVQGQRLFEYHHVDPLPQLRAQQRLAQRQAALGRCDRGDERAFENDERDDTRGIRGRTGLHAFRYGIHDERAYVGHRRGQNTGDQSQERQRHGESPVGTPDQLEGAPAVAEDAEKTTQRNGLALGGSCARPPRRRQDLRSHEDGGGCKVEVAGAIGCLMPVGVSPVIRREPRRKKR